MDEVIRHSNDADLHVPHFQVSGAMTDSGAAPPPQLLDVDPYDEDQVLLTHDHHLCSLSARLYMCFNFTYNVMLHPNHIEVTQQPLLPDNQINTSLFLLSKYTVFSNPLAQSLI